MKNKSLLRRGQFEIPVENDISLKDPVDDKIKTQKTEFIRSNVISKKHSLTMQKIKNNQKSSDSKNGFDKTLTESYKNYESLLNFNRDSKEEKRSFHNSMNRILAAEMIEYRVLKSGETMRNKKSRSKQL